MQFHFHANQSHFHKNCFALRLAMKQRHKGTRKSVVHCGLKFSASKTGCALHNGLHRPIYLPAASNICLRLFELGHASGKCWI